MEHSYHFIQFFRQNIDFIFIVFIVFPYFYLQIEIWENYKNYENKVYVLPKKLDEMVAMFHLQKVGAKLTEMSKDQSDYLGVEQQGPFKKDTYRY